MADVRAAGGGFNGTRVVFEAITDAGARWMENRGGFACCAITTTKTGAEEALRDLADFGLVVAWA